MTDLKQKTEHFLALADAATQGRWFDHGDTVWAPPDSDDEGSTCVAQECTNEDAAFIAAAHEMATHLRTLQAENDRMRGALIEAIKLPLPEADQQTASNYGICNDCYSSEALEDYARAIIDAAMNRERGE